MRRTFGERFPLVESAHKGSAVIRGTLEVSDVPAGRGTGLETQRKIKALVKVHSA